MIVSHHRLLAIARMFKPERSIAVSLAFLQYFHACIIAVQASGLSCANLNGSYPVSTRPVLEFLQPAAADNQALVNGSLFVLLLLRGKPEMLKLDPDRLAIQVSALCNI